VYFTWSSRIRRCEYNSSKVLEYNVRARIAWRVALAPRGTQCTCSCQQLNITVFFTRSARCTRMLQRHSSQDTTMARIPKAVCENLRTYMALHRANGKICRFICRCCIALLLPVHRHRPAMHSLVLQRPCKLHTRGRPLHMRNRQPPLTGASTRDDCTIRVHTQTQ
jgi:hypothetical protein